MMAATGLTMMIQIVPSRRRRIGDSSCGGDDTEHTSAEKKKRRLRNKDFPGSSKGSRMPKSGVS